MLGYGYDESAPTPCGMFVGYFRGRSLIFFGMFATLFQFASSVMAGYKQL